jgi:hypothetical protein
MRTTDTVANTFSKQRLRAELARQVEDFLQGGGRIDVVSGLRELPPGTEFTRWPLAAADVLSAPELDPY